MSNKVSVSIYGQEYTIVGSESNEEILKIAAFLDSRMREVGDSVPGLSTTSVAILAGINISSDYFSDKEEVEALRHHNEKLTNDSLHYINLWEEVKRDFAKYKEENMALNRSKEELHRHLISKQAEIDELKNNQSKYKEEVKKNLELDMKKEKESVRELESNFFDLQMENIRLKNELDKLKGGLRR